MTVDGLGARLQRLLRRQLKQHDLEVTDLHRLTGGASRDTWSFGVDGRRLVLQLELPGTRDVGAIATEAAILRAAGDSGVPVANVVSASGDPNDLGAGYLIADRVEGETIARRILRNDDYGRAREVLAADCGRALAAIHAVPTSDLPDLADVDQLIEWRNRLDELGDPHPTFEHALLWLERHRPPPSGRTLVHGDFRLGNLIVDRHGLAAVIDWELAHIGDPMEDLGWLCTRAWRFGATAPVAGVGSYNELFESYAESSGQPVDPQVVRWWEVLGTLKWGIMCIIQARKHLDHLSRSIELAAIGRRVCENEHDLLLLLEPDALDAAIARPLPPPAAEARLHGRPTAAELLEAVREWVDDEVRQASAGAIGFQSRVAANVLAMLMRENLHGPTMEAEHAERLRTLGIADEHAFAAGIRSGSLSGDLVIRALAESVVDKLRVANPRWFVGGAGP